MRVARIDLTNGSEVRIRVHELADYLGITASELMQRAPELGIDAHSALQSLNAADVVLLLDEYGADGVEIEDDVVIDLVKDSDTEPPANGKRTILSAFADLAERRWGIHARARRMAITAVLIVFGTVAVAVGVALLRPSHSAEAQILIGTSGNDSSAIERQLRSFEVIANSPRVLAPVADQFDLSLPDLHSLLSTEIQNDSQIIRLEVTDRDPAVAEAVTAAIVESYLEQANRPDAADLEVFLETETASVTERISEIDRQLAQLESTRVSIGAQRTRIESSIEVAENQLADLESRLADARTSSDAAPGAVGFLTDQAAQTSADLDILLSELETLETEGATANELEITGLERRRERLDSELDDLLNRQIDLEMEQVARPRAQVLSGARLLEDPAGLTPVRAVALGIVVGGVLAAVWVVGATQLRPER